MQERNVLAALITDRKAWEQVIDFLEERDFTAQGSLILKHVSEYYDADKQAMRCDRDLLIQAIGSKLQNSKQLDSFKDILADLPYDIGSKNVTRAVLGQKRDASGERLANALAAGTAEHGEITKLLEEYRVIHEVSDLESNDVTENYAPDVLELFTEELSDKNKIKVAPKALNDVIGGGAYPGHCIIIFGRVEMGKSMFALNMSVGFVAQDLKVLYAENEDSRRDTRRRFTQRLIRRPLGWIRENPAKARDMANKKGYERFLLNTSISSLAELEKAIIKNDPDVVVVNQLRHLVQGEMSVEKLDTLSHKVRAIGKKYDKLMVLITAANEGSSDKDGFSRDKPILEIGDVYGSRTGIPGAADLLVGWGSTDTMKRTGQGCASICKNKLVDEGGHTHLYLDVNPATGVIQ